MVVSLLSESEVSQSCPTLATPWTVAHHAPPSMGFSRQEYWSGVPLPSPLAGYRSIQNVHLFLNQFNSLCVSMNWSIHLNYTHTEQQQSIHTHTTGILSL